MSYAEQLRQQYKAARLRMGAMPPRYSVVCLPQPKVVEAVATAQPSPPPLPPPRPAPVRDIVIPDTESSERLSVARIIEAASRCAWCSTGDIVGPRRNKDIIKWRHVAVYLTVVLRPDLTYPTIASIFKRDHSTILYAHAKVRDNTEEYADHIAALLDLLP